MYVHIRGIIPRINTSIDFVTNIVPAKRRKDIKYSAISAFFAKSLVIAPDARGAFGLPIISLSISK